MVVPPIYEGACVFMRSLINSRRGHASDKKSFLKNSLRCDCQLVVALSEQFKRTLSGRASGSSTVTGTTSLEWPAPGKPVGRTCPPRAERPSSSGRGCRCGFQTCRSMLGAPNLLPDVVDERARCKIVFGQLLVLWRRWHFLLRFPRFCTLRHLTVGGRREVGCEVVGGNELASRSWRSRWARCLSNDVMMAPRLRPSG